MILLAPTARRPWSSLFGFVAGLVAGLAAICTVLPAAPALAEGAAVQAPVNVPGFWDPRRRPERPDLSRINVIRFLTETDYPPFNFAAPDGIRRASTSISRA